MLSFSTVAFCIASGLLSSAPSPTISVPFLEAEISIDGVLNEPAYSNGASLEGFSIYRPAPTSTPRFEAIGTLFADEEALYLGFRVTTGKTPLYAPRQPRDSHQNGDKIQIELSPYQSGRRAYLFEVSAGETLRDGTKDEMGDTDRAWDSLFDGRVTQTPTGFTAEIRIPFQSLRFDPKQNDWGMHVFIHSRHYEQSLSWAPINPDLNNWLLQMGEITGLKGRKPGRSVEILPSITGGWNNEEREEPETTCNEFHIKTGGIENCNTGFNYGVGLKWGITPSLTLDGVFNPDFSQIEADPAQLTLNNRFAISYEERRPFFMEGNDIFNNPFRVVYTRSINQPTGAVKLTGKMGKTRVGVLTAYDPNPPDSVLDDNFSASSQEFHSEIHAQSSVGRLQWDLNSQASVGGFVINKTYLRNGESIANNLVGGMDGQTFATDNLSIESSIFGSQSQDLNGKEIDGVAYRIRTVWKNDSFRLQSHYEHISSNFRSEAGYIPRAGYHNAFIKADGYYFSDNNWGKRASPGIYAGAYWDEYGQLSERIVGTNMWWLFGGHISVFSSYERRGERYEGSLEKHQGQWLDGNYMQFHLEISTFNWLSLQGGAAAGDTILRGSLSDLSDLPQGWFQDIKLRATLRPMNWLELNGELKQRTIKTSPGGSVLNEQPIARTSMLLFFTRDLYIRFFSEWEIDSHERVNDFLFSYVPSPGTVVFLGFQDKRSPDMENPHGTQTAFLKLSTNLVF